MRCVEENKDPNSPRPGESAESTAMVTDRKAAYKAYTREVGKRLREARETAGYEINDVAALMDWNRQTISTWENGHAIPPLDKMVECSRLYKVNLQYLATGSNPSGWEDLASLLEPDVRAQLLLITSWKAAGELVTRLRSMDDQDLKAALDLFHAMVDLKASDLEALQPVVKQLHQLRSQFPRYPRK